MKTTGKVTGIVSNLVTVEVNGPVAENELCYITLGDTKLLAEVIKVKGRYASVQVFESTRGLKNGDAVEFEGRMLEVTLGPGLMSSVYDGLQNNLATMDTSFMKTRNPLFTKPTKSITVTRNATIKIRLITLRSEVTTDVQLFLWFKIQPF